MLAYLFSASGRFKRWQYWSIHLTIPFVCILLFLCLGTIFGWKDNPTIVAVVGIALLVIDVWCSICATIKRYHDRGKSGWWWLLCLVPFLSIWQFIECGFLSGDEGDNEYGDGGNIDISEDLMRMGLAREPQAPTIAVAAQSAAPSRPTFPSGPKPMFGAGSQA